MDCTHRLALERHNLERWTALVRKPLQRARRLLQEVAPGYYLRWTLRARARVRSPIPCPPPPPF